MDIADAHYVASVLGAPLLPVAAGDSEYSPGIDSSNRFYKTGEASICESSSPGFQRFWYSKFLKCSAFLVLIFFFFAVAVVRGPA
jgi:hypothetical protein